MDRSYEHTTKRCMSSQIDAPLRADVAALAETRQLGDTVTGATLSLSPLRFSPDEMREVVDLYESNPEYCRAAANTILSTSSPTGFKRTCGRRRQ